MMRWIRYSTEATDENYYAATNDETLDDRDQIIDVPPKEFLEQEIESNYKLIEWFTRYQQFLHESLHKAMNK